MMFNVGELFLSDTWPDPGKCWTPLTPIDFSESWGHSWDQPAGLVCEMAAKASFCIQAGVNNSVKPEKRAGSHRREFKFLFSFLTLKWTISTQDGYCCSVRSCLLLIFFQCLSLSSSFFLLPRWRKRHLANLSPIPACLPTFPLLPN